jgi:transcriptional regulator GlxA family with amidase domain
MASFTSGILVFDGTEELDLAGPWEVLTVAASLRAAGDRVFTIAEENRPIVCSKGLRILPDLDFTAAPPLDLLLVPGGLGTRREVANPTLIAWLRAAGASARFVTSVCTGALLLHEAGFAVGKRVTTHWSFVEALRARGDVTVVEGERWVRDGNLVTSAGVSAGIDMALWVVGEIWSPDFARDVQRYMEYDPAPPYGN